MNNKNKRLIGFSTEFLWHTHPRVSIKTIQACKNIGCNAIELSCRADKEFELMDMLEKDDLNGFDFISFHAPVKIENPDILDKIQSFHNKFNFDKITIHPDNIKNWDILKSYNMPFSIENMDNRKTTGRTLESMKEIMSHSDYKVVLDINHIYLHDSSLKLAEDFWEEFKDRISHFHLSGCGGTYVSLPLIMTRQDRFIDFIKNKDKPIIIESVCKDPDQAQKEFNYITNYLNKK